MIKVVLNDIIKIISGGTPKTTVKEYWDNGEVGWLSVNDFNNDKRYVYDSEKKITQLGVKNSNTKYLLHGDIIISARGTVGALAQIGKPMCFNQSCFGIRGKENIVDTDFLYYSLKNYVQHIVKRSQGSVFDTINLASFNLMELEIPEKIETQKQIAKVLSDLDAKIEVNNKINAELETMAKTIYDYWFVQFDFPFDFAQGKPSLNGKPYKSSGGKMVYHEELKREIPEGWESEQIGNLLGKTKRIKKIPSSDYLEKGKIPIIDQSTKFICGFTNDEDAIINTKEPRIIFGDHTRILKLINFDFARGADGTQVLMSNSERMPQHLFYHSLLKIDLSNYGYARHFKFLKDIRIVIPERELGDKFEKLVKPYFKKIKYNILENQKLAELRDWLLPMLMNGQATVGDVVDELDICENLENN